MIELLTVAVGEQILKQYKIGLPRKSDNGDTVSRLASSTQDPPQVARAVLSLLNHWDAKRFRGLDWQPDDNERLKFYETHCFRPMNIMASGGLRFRLTKTVIEASEARVDFDILVKGNLNRPPQEIDPNEPDLYDRGRMLLVPVGDTWKFREISF